MKKLYYYEKESMSFKRYPKRNIILLPTLLFLTVGFVLGLLVTKTTIEYVTTTNYKMIGTQEWIDSTFQDYEQRAEIYLKKFKNTPIKAHMLRLAAHNAYDSTGIILPVELALTQAQMESSMGTKGRSPINNPFNVGEYDDGTVLYFESTFEGIQAYYYLMCRNYLGCKEIDILFKNFTNCHGNRYASKPSYEVEVEKQFLYVKKYINNRIYKDKEN
jgi:hypothetical protein